MKLHFKYIALSALLFNLLITTQYIFSGAFEDPKWDFYALLEIEPTTDTSVIRKAYREVSLKYHPDKIDQKINELLKANPDALSNEQQETIRKAANEYYTAIVHAKETLLEDNTKLLGYYHFKYPKLKGKVPPKPEVKEQSTKKPAFPEVPKHTPKITIPKMPEVPRHTPQVPRP